MRWLTLLVLLLATVAIYSEDEVDTGSTEEQETTEETEEEDNWEDDGVTLVASENFETFIEENEFVLVEFCKYFTDCILSETKCLYV